MSTLKNIAKIANCSVSTVSRAINNCLDVSEQTRARILEIAKEQGYFQAKKHIKAENRKKNHFNIAIISPEIESSYYSGTLVHITKEISRLNARSVIYDYSFDKPEIKKLLDMCQDEMDIDAIISLGANSDKSIRSNIPIIFPAKEEGFSSVVFDVSNGIRSFFKKAEKKAICKCFEIFELGECTDEMIARYSVINRGYWERLERKEITKPEVLVGRFQEFFATEGIVTDCAERFNSEYQLRLGDTICFCDDGYELVKGLKSRVKQYAVTNGTKVAQVKKLNKSGLVDLFDDVFISEDVGVEKPDVKFFEHVWDVIGQYQSDEVLIIGDSLTSDMKGGNNAGILCCWYNPKGLENTNGVKLDYEIKSLQEVIKILG